MLRRTTLSSLAMVGLLTLAAAPAEAGRRTGSWKFVNPNSAYAMTPFAHPHQHFRGYAGTRYGHPRHYWGHRGYRDHAPSPYGYGYGHRRYGPAW
jgi:hypothetical protein